MSVTTHEIVPDAWPQFLQEVTREHRGQLVNVRMSAADLGVHSEARRLALLGMEEEDAREGIDPVIRVRGGDEYDGQLIHVITSPSHLRVTAEADGKGPTIEIESSHGSTVRVEFSPERGS